MSLFRLLHGWTGCIAEHFDGENFTRGADSGKHGMTESSAERFAEIFSKTSEMVPNGLNIPMYES